MENTVRTSVAYEKIKTFTSWEAPDHWLKIKTIDMLSDDGHLWR